MIQCDECGAHMIDIGDSYTVQPHLVGCSKMLEPHVSVPPGSVTLNIMGSAAYVEDTFGGDVQGIAVAASRGFSVAREYLTKLAAVAECARRVVDTPVSKMILWGALDELDKVGFGDQRLGSDTTPADPSDP